MGRTYKINDNEYPSVTTVLDILEKPALKQWAVNMAIKYIIDNSEHLVEDQLFSFSIQDLESSKKEWMNVSKEAMDIGSEIHDLIEKYIKHGRDAIGKLRPEVENGFIAFLEWEDNEIDSWIESELQVHDPDYCYAGTLDAITKMKDGKFYVIDFKSSKGFYPGYDMQLAAYRNAMEKENKIKYDGMGVLRLDKETGIPQWKDYSKVYDDKLEAFLKLLDYYYAAANRRCKNKRTA